MSRCHQPWICRRWGRAELPDGTCPCPRPWLIHRRPGYQIQDFPWQVSRWTEDDGYEVFGLFATYPGALSTVIQLVDMYYRSHLSHTSEHEDA